MTPASSPENRREFLQQMAGSVAAFTLTPSLLPAAPRARRRALPVAVVGLGNQGTRLISELGKFESVAVAAICDVKSSRQRRGKRRAPAAQAYDSLEELLDRAPEVGAVFLATPTHLHREHALACLAAGKHVYCEGPMASTVEDLKAMATAARSAPTVFQVGHVVRSNPVYRLARSFLRSGSIRDPVYLRTHAFRKNSWRIASSGGEAEDRQVNWKLFADTSLGLPGELGSHQFDAVAWFLNKFPTSVSGRGSIMAYDDGRDLPDTVTCALHYPGGAEMTFESTLCNSFEGSYELFVGTMGSIKMAGTFGWMFKEADAPTQGWEVYASREKFHNEEGITLIADATKLAKQGKLREGIGLPHPPLYYAVQNFLKSVLEGQKVACTADDGLRAAAIALRCAEAVAEGQEKIIEEDLLKGA